MYESLRDVSLSVKTIIRDKVVKSDTSILFYIPGALTGIWEDSRSCEESEDTIFGKVKQ